MIAVRKKADNHITTRTRGNIVLHTENNNKFPGDTTKESEIRPWMEVRRWQSPSHLQLSPFSGSACSQHHTRCEQRDENLVDHPVEESCCDRRPAHTRSRSASSAKSAESTATSKHGFHCPPRCPLRRWERPSLTGAFQRRQHLSESVEQGLSVENRAPKLKRGFQKPLRQLGRRTRSVAAMQLGDMKIEASVLRKLLDGTSFCSLLPGRALKGQNSSFFWKFAHIKSPSEDIARHMSIRLFFLLENVVPTDIKDLKDMEVALDVKIGQGRLSQDGLAQCTCARSTTSSQTLMWVWVLRRFRNWGWLLLREEMTVLLGRHNPERSRWALLTVTGPTLPFQKFRVKSRCLPRVSQI